MEMVVHEKAAVAANRSDSSTTVASHNKREGKERGTGKVQRGGTATILRDELTVYVTNSGADPSGLGKWPWYLLEGEEGSRTAIQRRKFSSLYICLRVRIFDSGVCWNRDQILQIVRVRQLLN